MRGPIKVSTLEWDANGKTGSFSASFPLCGVSGECYTLNEGIKRLLAIMIEDYANKRATLMHSMNTPRGWFQPGATDVSGWVDPIPYFTAIQQNFTERCARFVNESPKDEGNFWFLMGIQHDWKTGCVICLADEIKGTTCGCGHTETIVFRECGHSICANPCYLELMRPAKKRSVPEGTLCPTCRAPIDRIFQAEDVRFEYENNILLDAWVDEICLAVSK
jgi:hypothetical protein